MKGFHFTKDFLNISRLDFRNMGHSQISKLIAEKTKSQFTPQKDTEFKSNVSPYNERLNTTEDSLYFVIIKAESYEKIDFQFIPETINNSRNATSDTIKPIGRNLPKYHYTGGQDTLNFRLDFHSDIEDKSDVAEKCRIIKSLSYSNGYEDPKPIIKLVWGDLFRNELWEMQTVNISYQQFKPGFNMLPQQAYVDVSLALVAYDDQMGNPTWGDVR